MVGCLRLQTMLFRPTTGAPSSKRSRATATRSGPATIRSEAESTTRTKGGVRSTAWISGGPLDKAVVAAGRVAPSASPGQDQYWGLMHAVDWLPTLGSAVGFTPTPKTAGIVLDGTMTSTLFFTVSHAFSSATPMRTRRVLWSMWCSCWLGSDLCLEYDAVTNLGLQASITGPPWSATRPRPGLP